MARIVRQSKVWHDLKRELPPGLQELQVFLWVLSEFDAALVWALREERGHGRDDHPVSAMWNLIAIGLYLRNGKFSELLAELNRNSDLARLLGFEEIGPNQYKIPSDSALSRFHVKLKEHYLDQVEAVLKKTVQALASENPEFGKHTSIDARVGCPDRASPGASPPRRVPRSLPFPIPIASSRWHCP